MAVIAVVFDFDDTLLPDSTTALLASRGIDTTEFWTEKAPGLVARGYDPPMAYLRLMLDLVGDELPLGPMSNEDLRTFGATLDSTFFSGIPEVFNDLRSLATRDISIEFYIVSSGLYEVIKGSSIVQEHFSGVYACHLDEEDGVLRHVKRCVTFTEKTRFLFEINKGIEPNHSDTNPGLVNTDVAVGERRVPFENMVYAGDGLTDIPCFSLVSKNGGTAFGIFEPGKVPSAKKAFQEFLKAGRVVSSHAPRFGPEDELGALLRAAVSSRVTALAVRRGSV